MIYIIFTYLFSPLIYILLFLKKNRAERVLIIQTAKIGDLICSSSVFRVVRKKYPAAHIVVMANPVGAELFSHNPYVNEVLPVESCFYKGFSGKVRLARLICKGRYDIGISLNPNVPFTLAMFWGLVPVRLSLVPDFTGITYIAASVFSTHLERHKRGRLVADTYMEMLKAIGIDSKDVAKDVFKSPDADEKVERFLNSELQTPNSKLKVGLAVTSGNRLKEWGAEKMAALSDKLIIGLGAKIILIGSKKDRDVSDEILRLAKSKNAILDAAGKFNLAELPALIERLSVFIGVDTGILYMADALNIPVVDIAGPSDMEDQRPTGKKVVIMQKDISCVPCSHSFKAPYDCRYGHRKCITDISVEEVFQGASKLLG